MTKPLTWQSLEYALVHIARVYKLHVDQDPESGDKLAIGALCLDDDTIKDLNITELAKDLERELKP